MEPRWLQGSRRGSMDRCLPSDCVMHLTECTECDYRFRRGLIGVSWVPLCKQQSLFLHETKAWLSSEATVGSESLAVTDPTDMPRQKSSSSLIGDLTGSNSMSKGRHYTSRSYPCESWRQRQHLDADHRYQTSFTPLSWADTKSMFMQDNAARGLGLLYGTMHRPSAAI